MGERPRWRLLRDGITDPFLHFAVEEAILRGVDEGTSPETLRLRQVEPSVFIGIYQEPDDEVDLGFCEQRGIKIVRRQNPGGAVYQDRGSFCYSATFRRAHLERWALEDPSGLYAKAGMAVVAACAQFGTAARAKPVNDVEIDGRKVYGSAQIDWYDAFVHSGTFLVSTDIGTMAAALRPSPIKFADKPGKAVRERVVTLCEAAGRVVPIEDVMAALCTELARELDVELVPGELSDGELAAAKQLLYSKYGRREWTFRGKESLSTVLSAKARSGVVTVEADLRGGAIERLQVRGDFLIADQRPLEAVLTRLRGAQLEEAPAILARSALPEDVRDTICRLLRELTVEIPS